MTDSFDSLSPEQRRKLASSITELCAGGMPHRQRLKAIHPEIEDAIDQVFDGLAVWNALQPSSHPFMRPAFPSENIGDDDPIDVENLTTGHVVIPSMDSRLGSGFELVEKIGRGGSGVVYRALLPNGVQGRRDVAIKLLASGDALEASRRFRDVQVLRGFEHRNLVRVFAAGDSIAYGPFVATEFVEGLNLSEWLDIHGRLGDRESAEVVRVLALALHAAHEQGVVHCDVKPSNVFGCGTSLEPEHLKLGDFGLSRFTAIEQASCPNHAASPGRYLGGTHGYMAPEQYWGNCDRRLDIYALGATLLRLLVPSRSHFLDESQARALQAMGVWQATFPEAGGRRQVVLGTFRELGLLKREGAVGDLQLRAIVAKCLAFDPERRYRTASDLAEDLRAWLERYPLKYAEYCYAGRERLSLLVGRCRHGKNIEDHSELWGIASLTVGSLAVMMSTLCTILTLLGRDPSVTRLWTSLIYIVVAWLVVYPVAAWITRCRRPTAQLVGYNLIYLVAYVFLRRTLMPDRAQCDAVQFLITGILLGCIGLGSRHWLSFLYSSLLILALSWPVAIVVRQPSFAPFGPALLGLCQGLPLIAFGASYLWPVAGSPPEPTADR